MIPFFLNRKTLVTLITLFLVAMGLSIVFQIPRSSYPDVEFNIMIINTAYPGASSQDVEVKVTQKIEDELQSVRDIDKIRSVSVENLSLVYVWIESNALNPDQVKDDIRRAVDRVTDLPSEVEERPVVTEMKTSNVSVIEIAVVGGSESQRRLAAKDLEEQIKDIDGVGSVDKVGYRDKEVHILVDHDKLNQNYLSLGEIMQAIEAQNIRVSGGTLKHPSNEKKVVTDSEFNEPLDVKKVIVRQSFQGGQLKLEDVAKVRLDYEEALVLTRTRGQESINLLVKSQAKADVVNISQSIQILLDQIKPSLPQGIEAKVVVDFSIYTKSLLGLVQSNAFIGFFLVLIVLFVFLNTTTAFWTAVGIPISFLGAVALFPLFEVEINFISLITLILVLGMLVDDAIVVAENISRHREKGLSPVKAALLGATEVRGPVTATVLTTIVAFSSIWFMTGITGKFVRQIPVVVVLTLAFSLFESLCILPSHIAHTPHSKPRNLRWFEALKNWYAKVIEFVIKRRGRTIASFLVFLALAYTLVVTVLRVELFPYDDVDLFYVVAELEEGVGLEETSNRLKEIEGLIENLSTDAIVNYTTTVGHHDRDVYGASSGKRSNWGMITVFLKPAQQREQDSKEIMAALEPKVKELLWCKRCYLDKFNDGPPVGRPITINLVSNNDHDRQKYAKEVFDFLKNTKGILNLERDDRLGKKEIRIRPNYQKMARLGVTSQALAKTLRSAYSGVVVTSITRAGEEIDYRVRLKDSQRANPSQLLKIKVINDKGRLISLAEFVSLSETQDLDAYRHYNTRRSVGLVADVDATVITSGQANQKIREAFEDKIANVPGLTMIFGGEEKESQKSFQSFSVALVLSLFVIYGILVVLFDSFLQPLIIVSIVPFGLAGVVFTFLFYNMPLSFLAIIGTLGLVGVMVNDSLVMVSHLKATKDQHKDLPLEVMVQACQDRLRPVVLTTITTVVGLVPTIYGIGGYEPFIVPLVLSLAGGLVFATPITLIWVPVLYSFFVKRKTSSNVS